MTRTGTRVVVALGPADAPDFVLDIARHLPSSASAELLGVFIEDIGLLEHARSRVAREVVLSGAARPLSLVALEGQLRARSAELRRRFGVEAERLGLRHSFEAARGEFIGELVRRSAEAEALIVSLAVEARGRPAWWPLAVAGLARAPVPAVLFARSGWSTGKSILVIAEDPDYAARSLPKAARLARRSRSALILLLAGRALRERAGFLPALSLALRARGTDLITEELTALDEQSIVGAARRANARLLVLPKAESAREIALAETLLERLRSAVLLVS